MQKTTMSMVAGILDIVAAVLKLFTFLGLIVAIIAVKTNPFIDPSKASGGVPVFLEGILWFVAVPLGILAVMAILGGIAALGQRNWGLALAGSICAALPLSLLGIAAVVLTVLARDGFERTEGP
jgi:hypothetical protein